MGEEQVTDEQFDKLMEGLVKAISSKTSDSNGSPKTWADLVWKSASTFGIPTVLVGVIMLIVYQTFPGWVAANIRTQESLTSNLQKQTENIEAQTKNTEEMTTTITEVRDSIKQVASESQSMQQFTRQVIEDHKAQMEAHAAQMETQKKMLDSDVQQLQQSVDINENQKKIVEILESIQNEIGNP